MSQIDFATHCATTACGISSQFLNAKNDMVRSVYRFHVAFATRKILNKLGVKLPYVERFNPDKSGYIVQAYNEICDQFSINPEMDWR